MGFFFLLFRLSWLLAAGGGWGSRSPEGGDLPLPPLPISGREGTERSRPPPRHCGRAGVGACAVSRCATRSSRAGRRRLEPAAGAAAPRIPPPAGPASRPPKFLVFLPVNGRGGGVRGKLGVGRAKGKGGGVSTAVLVAVRRSPVGVGAGNAVWYPLPPRFLR